MQKLKHVGIDFGAKNAGTTAICYEIENELQIHISKKNKNADHFIHEHLNFLHPEKVFIDAPLSLPLAYYGKSKDFFYRKVDKELQAMSPMFLGGLTARAMQLKANFPKITFFETYPKYLVKTLELQNYYKKNTVVFTKELNSLVPFLIPKTELNWHEIDAILAWFSGFRFSQKQVIVFGDESEGFVYI